MVSEEEYRSDLVDAFLVYHHQLCHCATRILGDREKAEDVVQDAYLKIIEADAVFTIKQFKAYVFRVVRNLAIDRYRRIALESNLFTVINDSRDLPASTEMPEALSISREQLYLIVRALQQLPARTQRVFELHRMQGLTQREIAKQLGVSSALVNAMIRDALNHCHNAIYT